MESIGLSVGRVLPLLLCTGLADSLAAELAVQEILRTEELLLLLVADVAELGLGVLVVRA